MIARRNAPALALLTLSLSGLLLTGCAAGASASDSNAAAEATAAAEAPAAAQTVEEACGLMEAALTDDAAAMQEGLPTFTSDPAPALAALQTLAGDFEAVRSEVEVAEVKAAADAAGVELDAMIVDLEAIIADPASADLTSFLANVQSMQAGFVAIGEICGG